MRELHGLKQEDREKHQKTFGGYNDFPPNWRAIRPDEIHWFWSMFMSYTPDMIEHRQMLGGTKTRVTCVTAKLYHFWGGEGIAFVDVIEKAQHAAPKLYRFAACEHTWKGVPEKSRMCYTVSRCVKCGLENAVDSSD
jgi:hypothetical protein